eukprot:14224537-Alexandrium_andersonii.AAC.1
MPVPYPPWLAARGSAGWRQVEGPREGSQSEVRAALHERERERESKRGAKGRRAKGEQKGSKRAAK